MKRTKHRPPHRELSKQWSCAIPTTRIERQKERKRNHHQVTFSQCHWAVTVVLNELLTLVRVLPLWRINRQAIYRCWRKGVACSAAFYRWVSINRFAVSVLPHICGLELSECSFCFGKKYQFSAHFVQNVFYCSFFPNKLNFELHFLGGGENELLFLFGKQMNFEFFVTRIESIIWSLLKVIDNRFRFLIDWSPL